MYRVVSLLVVASVLSACSGQSLSNREKGVLGGAAAGAGLGAIIGSATGNAGVGTAIGGGIGALTGAVVGNEMDKGEVADADREERLRRQEEQLRQQQREIDELKRQRGGDSSGYRDNYAY